MKQHSSGPTRISPRLIAAEIDARRCQSGMTWDRLGDSSNIAAPERHGLENGHLTVTAAQLQKILAALRVTMEEFVFGCERRYARQAATRHHHPTTQP